LWYAHLTSVFLLPLIARAVARYLQGEIDGRGVGWRLGVLFGLQFWVSTEVCASRPMGLGFGLVVAYATWPGPLGRLRSVLRRLAVFDHALPVRFSVYAALAAAVIVALWTAHRGGWPARILPALAVASLVPALWQHPYRFHPERWEFFTSGRYEECIPKGENVAIFPFGAWGSSTLWQAETNFWFRMPGGYLTPTPPA